MRLTFKNLFFYIIALSLFLFPHTSMGIDEDGFMPKIAKWYNDKCAAVSLRFDDALASHVKTAIPLLNQYGIKATFMVNPGLSRYRKYKDIWEKEVPKMGHHLGNHTMNHRGAKDLEEANYEIGEVSRLIWKLYPEQSKLMVFASGGGGKKWGGEYWENASEEYKSLVTKYHLIDLYDGTHRAFNARSDRTARDLCAVANLAKNKNSHQSFTFHNIGKPLFKDIVRKILLKKNYSFETKELKKFFECLNENKNKVWIAPIVEILKYETEFNSAKLIKVSHDEKSLHLFLRVTTDPQLWDQKLTLVIPPHRLFKIKSVKQNGNLLKVKTIRNEKSLVNIRPINSDIILDLD